MNLSVGKMHQLCFEIVIIFGFQHWFVISFKGCNVLNCRTPLVLDYMSCRIHLLVDFSSVIKFVLVNFKINMLLILIAMPCKHFRETYLNNNVMGLILHICSLILLYS